MKVKLYILFTILGSYNLFSQVPEDALKLSWYSPGGTARNLSIGGAIVGLGGDLTANHVNPAGLGFYKTSDFVLTPAWKFGKVKSNFRGTKETGESHQNFVLGTSGFIIGGLGPYAENRTAALALSVTKLADFNSKTFYRGQNDYSSFAEPLADEFALSGLTIDQALNGNVSLQTKLALYSYLVDTATVNGNTQVIARSEAPSIREQASHTESSGGITEIAFGIGGEVTRKFLVGVSLGIPIIKLERESWFRESDITGNTDNDFAFLNYAENMRITGGGINVKAGLIFRPQDYFRLGLTIQSPSMLVLKESFSSGLAVDVEQLFGSGSGYDSVSSSVFLDGNNLVNRYTLNTPFKVALGGAFVFREVENVTRQRGFISADIEYTNYKWIKYSPTDENIAKEVFDPYNEAIDAIYKGAFNFRVGGELKFNVVMARLGFAYYGNPNKDSELKASKMNLSGGLGYRHKGFFIDLTYLHQIQKDVQFPYRVNPPRANTFAELKEQTGNVLLTLGFKI